MSNIFTVTVSQMFVLFFFMALGYFFKKKNITPETTPAVLSKLEFNVFLPALSFSNFASNFTRDIVASKIKPLLWAVALLTVTAFVSWGISHFFSKNKNTQAVYTYALTIPNLSYMGYPLIQAVFGDAVLFDYIVFCLPFFFYIYTVAMYILNPKRVFSFKKLLNPSIIALFLGAVVGISGVEIPQVISKILSTASSCMAPLAMLLSGYILARSPVLELVKNPKMYLASLLRLVVYPIVFTSLLWFCGADNHTVMIGACLLSLPMGLNNIVFPEAFGGDSKTGAQSCFVCNVLGLFTVPVMFTLITQIFA